jgi:hypothetical protein
MIGERTDSSILKVEKRPQGTGAMKIEAWTSHFNLEG